MTNLRERLGQPDKRKTVVADACEVLDQEVAGKPGLSGVAIRGAYSIVKNIKPGFIAEVVDGLLDDFLDVLDPFCQEAVQKGQPAGNYVAANGERVAEKLLAITDERAARSSRAVIRKTYDKLRPTVQTRCRCCAPARSIAGPASVLTRGLSGRTVYLRRGVGGWWFGHLFWRDTRLRIGYQPAPCLLLKIREPAVANASAEPKRTPLGSSVGQRRIRRPPSPKRPPRRPPESVGSSGATRD